MKFFPTIEYVDEIPQSVYKELRNAHRITNLGGTYRFSTKHIMIKKNTGQTFKTLLHELGHWFIAIFTKSYKIHTLYDDIDIKMQRISKKSRQ